MGAFLTGRRLQPLRVLRGAADRLLRADDPFRRRRRFRAGCSTWSSTCSARRCSCSRSARSTPRPARSTWPTWPSEVARPAEHAGLRAWRGAAADGLRVKAAICRCISGCRRPMPRPGAGGRAVRHHDQGRRLCHHPVLHAVFRPDGATQGLFGTWLLPAALVTLAVGMTGVLGRGALDRLVAFSVIGSMGTLMSALSRLHARGASPRRFTTACIPPSPPRRCSCWSTWCAPRPGRVAAAPPRRSRGGAWLPGCSLPRPSRWRGCRRCRALSASC